MHECNRARERKSEHLHETVCAASRVGRSGFLKEQLLLWHRLNKATGENSAVPLFPVQSFTGLVWHIVSVAAVPGGFLCLL